MRDVLQQESLYYFVILHQSVYLNFMLAFAIKAKKQVVISTTRYIQVAILMVFNIQLCMLIYVN